MIALLSLFSLSLSIACSEPDPRAEDWSQHYQTERAALADLLARKAAADHP